MSRPQYLFATGAVALLVFGILSRFFMENLSFALQWRGNGYLFPVLSPCTAMAVLFCMFSAAYSLWMLPINEKAGMWHFWLTSAGVMVYWFSFLGLAEVAQSGGRAAPHLHSVVAWGQIASIPVLLVAQTIFVVNLTAAVSKFHMGHP